MEGSGTQKFVYQQWPDQIGPLVHFVFPTMVTLVLEGGSRWWVGWVGGAPPMVVGRSNVMCIPPFQPCVGAQRMIRTVPVG